MSFVSRPPEIIRTDSRNWEDDVLLCLLDADDALVIDPATDRRCFISGRQFGREPVWPVAWRLLRAAGIAARRRW
jgi:hypothetical protein